MHRCLHLLPALGLMIAPSLAPPARAALTPEQEELLRFAEGSREAWTDVGGEIWTLGLNPPLHTNPGDPDRWVINSFELGEANTGILRSDPFTIREALQRFAVAGWDGTLEANNDGTSNWVRLRRAADDALLREAHTPGQNTLAAMSWNTADLIGEEVYLEVVDGNDGVRFGGFAWIAFADYRQVALGDHLRFESGTLDGWTAAGDPDTWQLEYDPDLFTAPDDAPRWVVSSLRGGEARTGTLTSLPFTISTPLQRFSISGWDGVTPTGTNDGDLNVVRLRRVADDAILRQAHTPGGNVLTPVEWATVDLIGTEVYVEVVDANPMLRPGGFAWIAFADYRQVELSITDPVTRDDIYAVQIDPNAEPVVCRSVPFMAHNQVRVGEAQAIEIGSAAETLYLLGLINSGWDCGLAHWGEHPEMDADRADQLYVGLRIGAVEVHYQGGAVDTLPLVLGATAWWSQQWAHGPTHGVATAVREPFATRSDAAALLQQAWRLRENSEAGPAFDHARFYVAVTPRAQVIERIVVRDEATVRGTPLISGVTLAGAGAAAGLRHFPDWTADAADLAARIDLSQPPDWDADVAALADFLYTDEGELPADPSLIEPMPGASDVRFRGGEGVGWGAMLTNVWRRNLEQIGEKFPTDSGFFHETGSDSPWYGGYSGIGTWAPVGVYHDGAFARCSDHFASLALRHIENPTRLNAYVDFVDGQLYFFRNNNDPALGPPNDALDWQSYPADAPPHWTFVINGQLGIPWPINELPSNEETDGHGATAVGRWLVWRHMGAPTGDWLTAPRAHVYNKSRWDSTRDAAEFICWLMDYTGRDVIWCEGETTGWGGGPSGTPGRRCPDDMHLETDPVRIRENYRQADMYEPYPAWVCQVALRCSAEVADALGETASAARWRSYAERIRVAMRAELTVGEPGAEMWRQSPNSVYPSFQESLVHAWFSIYLDGYDPKRWDADLTPVTRRTLARQLAQRPGTAPVLATGYGIGWLTKAALLLDEMDAAAELVPNIARYSYDKNMDYADGDVDWRPHLWLLPEGANILPDGSWHRIGDLSNGANQGPAMHALEVCAGVDDTDPADPRLMPRVPATLSGIEVADYPLLVPAGDGLARAKIAYRYQRGKWLTLTSDRPLPVLSVRVGPFAGEAAAIAAEDNGRFPEGSTLRREASGTFAGGEAWWLWIEGLSDVRSLDIRLDTSAGVRGELWE